ncbi:winged helix-turn-helix transcriptional regulator [Mycoplasma sp. 06067-C1-B144P-99-0482-3]|uniref:winged helix-turn-helix transcriptional regulator n=1 Tax=Mycoplasma sp. 06067-C1-B144P-99-0482-3 TaxID=3117438 RepID=UPI003DA2FC3A
MFTILDNKSYAEIKKRILDIFAKDPKRSCLSIAKQFNKSVSTIKRYKKEYLDFINTGKEIILSHKNVNNKNAQKYSDETNIQLRWSLSRRNENNRRREQ